MHKRILSLVVILPCLVTLGCAATPAVRSTADPGAAAQLFGDMGTYRRPITTSSPEAQRYFDQGMTWMYAFNHDEAVRSFTRAGQLDPDCAIPWWGVALCHGPQYNHPVMTDAREQTAWEALEKAFDRIENASPVERALIEALRARYANPWPQDRTGLNLAYADAMAEVWADHPDDPDVGTLYAESMMVLNPWRLYALDHTPKPDTDTIVQTLERVLDLDPYNPGANHLYIHAVEPSAEPALAEAAADRLCDLVPASGHLRHMPSHIYVQVGRWEDAIVQNELAVSVDAVYRERSREQLTQYVYMAHNAHMLAYALMMSGRERDAMAAAREMWEIVPAEAQRQIGPPLDRWMCAVYDVQKRFGRWDELIDEPAPPKYLPITRVTWRACRAVAYAARGDIDKARHEHEQFRKAKTQIPEDMMWGRDDAHAVLDVGDDFIAGEIALQTGDLATAARHLETAARLEDELTYGEPPQWLQPVRHTLGAVYLQLHRYSDAERVYREDLAKWPGNGWSLFGLSRALDELGRHQEAREVRERYHAAWKKADKLTRTSCLCIPET